MSVRRGEGEEEREIAKGRCGKEDVQEKKHMFGLPSANMCSIEILPPDVKVHFLHLCPSREVNAVRFSFS